MPSLGGSLYTPPLTMHQGSEVTDVDNPLVKQMKRIVQTNVANTNTVELQNLSLEVESGLQTNYADKDNMEGDDECEDNDIAHKKHQMTRDLHSTTFGIG